MERFAADRYINMVAKIAGASQYYAGIGQRAITQQERGELLRLLNGVGTSARAIGLKVTARWCEQASANVEEANLTVHPVSQLLSDMGNVMSSEMSVHLFLRVYPERADFYDQAALFGDEVNAAFPLTVRDIREAGNCYVADRTTACVMHCMRVLEIGLNSLADAVQVPFERKEWNTIIDQIEAKIENINGPHAGTDWRERQRFMSEAAKDFRYFKNAWRNHAMHARDHYDANEAKTIFDHVGAFMKHLAEYGLRQPGLQ